MPVVVNLNHKTSHVRKKSHLMIKRVWYVGFLWYSRIVILKWVKEMTSDFNVDFKCTAHLEDANIMLLINWECINVVRIIGNLRPWKTDVTYLYQYCSISFTKTTSSPVEIQKLLPVFHSLLFVHLYLKCTVPGCGKTCLSVFWAKGTVV